MYKKIMVPLDGSELAECVLPHVKAFVDAFSINEVLLVRVIEPVKPDLRVYDNIFDEEFIQQAQKIWRDVEKQERTSAKAYLDQVSDRIKQKSTTVLSEVLVGDVAKSLADYTENKDIDLIIMATHGHSGVKRWIMGSVADKLLRSSSLPVFMVRAAGV